MLQENFHISEQDLLLAADGELSRRRMAQVRHHLAACWSCRARLRRIESAIVDFVEAHQDSLNAQLPPAAASRALLRARLAEQDATQRTFAEWFFELTAARRALVWASLALAVAFGVWSTPGLRTRTEPQASFVEFGRGATPDPGLTPGATVAVTRDELCAPGTRHRTPAIPRAVALQVFKTYGIADPSPRGYELDHLITPELGGSADVRNLWPQPYQASSWSAHAKDALEDHLYQLVCDGNIDLATAQREIATDWISAYKKYFRTDEPLLVHAQFLKDQPWE
jgi:hypothetical protein